MKLAKLTQIAAETVARAQRELPAEIRGIAEAVPVHYEAVPDPSVLAEGFELDLLGLFTGNPYSAELVQAEPQPPQIILYLTNLWDEADGDRSIFRDEVRVTYLHELGHYLGWNEDQLAARGLD